MKSDELYPANDFINGNIANLLYKMNKYDESIEYFERALKSESDMNHPEVGPPLLKNYATLLYLRQKFSKSMRMCYRMINRKDWIHYQDKDSVYWLMTINCESMLDYDSALSFALKASKLKPNNKLYLNRIKKLRYMI